MTIKDFIKDNIPPLKETDTVDKALKWMNVLKVKQLPVLSQKNYLGLIDFEILDNAKSKEATIFEINPPYSYVYIYESQFVNDALQLISNYKNYVLPVLNSKNEYTGMLTAIDVIECVAQSKSIKTPGGIVVLNVPVKDFSLSSIANIIESNEGKILSATVEQLPDITLYQVTIKINKLDLSRILAGFYRHNMNVVATYNHNDGSGDVQDRFDSFMSYLNV